MLSDVTFLDMFELLKAALHGVKKQNRVTFFLISGLRF